MIRAIPLAAATLLVGAAPANDVPRRALFAGADPAALVEDGRLWLYPTGDGRTLHAWSSTDLTRWARSAPLISRDAIGWIPDREQRSLWAPHMTAANGRWYLYYSVGPQEPQAAMIGVAVCETPAGPCRDSGKPLVDGADSMRVVARPAGGCADGMVPTGTGRFHFEAIDPMVFVDPTSGRRLLYAGGSNGSTLRIWELAADMVTLARELPVSQPPCFTEGAWVHVENGTYYLSYSAGHWNRSDYSVRYATATSPTGPWVYRGTILASSGGCKGPGHHAFVRDPGGNGWLMAYHRWEGQAGDGPYRRAQRQVALTRISYRADGTIVPVDLGQR